MAAGGDSPDETVLGPEIIAEIAAEIADRRGIPRDWLTQIWRLAEPPEKEAS